MRNELGRRRLLAVGGSVATTVAFAGCFEPGEGEDDEDDEGDGEGGLGGEDDDRLAEPSPQGPVGT